MFTAWHGSCGQESCQPCRKSCIFIFTKCANHVARNERLGRVEGSDNLKSKIQMKTEILKSNGCHYRIIATTARKFTYTQITSDGAEIGGICRAWKRQINGRGDCAVSYGGRMNFSRA